MLNNRLNDAYQLGELVLEETPFITEFAINRELRYFGTNLKAADLAVGLENYMSYLLAAAENGFSEDDMERMRETMIANFNQQLAGLKHDPRQPVRQLAIEILASRRRHRQSSNTYRPAKNNSRIVHRPRTRQPLALAPEYQRANRDRRPVPTSQRCPRPMNCSTRWPISSQQNQEPEQVKSTN